VVADVPANSWELRADVAPLDAAAARWSELAGLMTRRGDEIVDAARRATDGWDAAAAESYDQHRRQVLTNLDRFTVLASSIAGSLRAVSSIITSSQKELDQAWTKVAMVPHDVVGESRYLVFHPSEDEDKGKVTQGQQETDEIRSRLAMSLDQESARLRSARAELVSVRTELKSLADGVFPGLLIPGVVEATSGVGMVPPPSTSVPGSAQAGIGALPPIAASMPVSMPDLDGISTGLAPIAGAAASGILGRGGVRRDQAVTPPMGGAGGMGMGARAGTMSRGMASGRAGARRMATPRLENTPVEDAAARAAREKEIAKEAKRAALEEKRAERAARKAERESDKRDDKADPLAVVVEDDDHDHEDDPEGEADVQAPVSVRIEDLDEARAVDEPPRGPRPGAG
jgi:hypothetical protein